MTRSARASGPNLPPRFGGIPKLPSIAAPAALRMNSGAPSTPEPSAIDWWNCRAHSHQAIQRTIGTAATQMRLREPGSTSR